MIADNLGGKARSHGISSNGIDLLILKYSGFRNQVLLDDLDHYSIEIHG